MNILYIISILFLLFNTNVWHKVKIEISENGHTKIKEYEVLHKGDTTFIKKYDLFTNQYIIKDTNIEFENDYYFYETYFPKIVIEPYDIKFSNNMYELDLLKEKFDTSFNDINCTCNVYYLKYKDIGCNNCMDLIFYFDIKKRIIVMQKEFYSIDEVDIKMKIVAYY